MATIWGFGTAAIDIRISTAEYGLGYTEKLLAQETRWQGGGSTSNFLVQCARLGMQTAWIGKLGKDAIGDMICKMLAAEGVDISNIIREESSISPFNLAVYAENYSRRVGGFLLPNSQSEISKEDIRDFVSKMSVGDYVLIEVGEIPLDICAYFGKLAKEKDIKIVVDVDLDPIKQCRADLSTVEELFGAADYLMPNATSLGSMYPEQNILDTAKMLAERFECITIVTAGSEGCVFFDGNGQTRHQSAVPIQVVDTVGAGDAFHGGVVSALCAGLPIDEAVRWGNICGAYNCLTFGAREGMIRRETLTEWLKNWGG